MNIEQFLRADYYANKWQTMKKSEDKLIITKKVIGFSNKTIRLIYQDANLIEAVLEKDLMLNIKDFREVIIPEAFIVIHENRVLISTELNIITSFLTGATFSADDSTVVSIDAIEGSAATGK